MTVLSVTNVTNRILKLIIKNLKTVVNIEVEMFNNTLYLKYLLLALFCLSLFYRAKPKASISFGNRTISHFMFSGTSEMSMQKKKTSPRNSPRNPSSPRNPCSPRGGGSPRGDVLPGTPGRQPFLTNQDILEAHLSRESHSKSYREGGRSPLLEQRKSPFNMMSAANSIPAVAGNLPNLIAGHEPMHHISVDTVRMSAQCNIDNIALLKSAQMMAFSNAPNDNSAFLQKLEELKPLLQKLKNPTAPMSVVPNGLESVSRLSKSPGPAGAQTKTSNHSDAHTVNSIAVTSNSVNAGHCVTNVLTSNSNNSVPSSVSKVSKANSEDQKGSSSANARRSSPGSATSSSNPIHSFDSSLPPPKRLTESVQKLLNFPLDPSNPLPHHRRSPQSCASVTRTCSSQVTAQCNVTTRGVTPTFVPSSVQGLVSSKHPSTDTTHIDLDSINPSITAVGGLGPIMLPLDTSQNACMDVTVPAYSNMQHLSLTDTLPVNLDYQGVVSNLTTKLVPAVKGSISSHKSGESAVSSKPVSDSQINQLLNKNTSVSVAATAVVKTTVCNSDSKMAVVSATTTVDSQNKTLTSSIDTSGPPVLQPVQSQASVRYPVPVISDKPKVGYPQMLLSEMLQETATPFRLTERPPITAAQATSTVQSTVSSVQVTAQVKVSSTTTVATSDNSSINKETVAVEKNVETVTLKTEVVASSAGSGLKESNCKSSADQTVKTSDTDSGKKNTNDNSDIPKLKRQTNLSVHIGRTNSSPISTPVLGSDSCDSDMGKSQDSCSSSSSTPPVLTAVSDIPEIKRGSTSESDIESKDNNSLDTVNQSSASSNVTPQSQTNTDPVKTKLANISNDDNPPDLTHTRTAVELSDKKINSMSEDTEVSHVSHVKGGKSLRKRRASSESVEEKQDDHDLAPRQLRSRKRTNPHDNDSGTAEDSKRPKLDPGSESTVSQPKETKDSKTAANAETSNDESNSHNDSIKSGLRTRTNTKLPSTDNSDKSKPPTGRETRKDGKVQAAKVPEKKPELVKQEDNKRTPQSRRNRQSPSVQTPEKTAPAAGWCFICSKKG